MLQVQTSPEKGDAQPSEDVAAECAFTSAKDMNFAKSSACLPEGLQEKHLELLRTNAATLASGKGTFLASGSKANLKRTTGAGDVSMDPADLAASFKEVTSMCCPTDTEIFFNRLVESKGLQVCSKPHVQGLVHWFSCVPDMDVQYLIDTIDNGNPCKFWAPSGET